MNILKSIGWGIFAIGSFIAGMFGYHAQQYGANPGSLPSVTANYSDSLAANMATTDTTFTLVSGQDSLSRNLTGKYCFTVDPQTSLSEFVCGTASGTSVTAVTRGIDPLNWNATSSALIVAHRRGASVTITDYTSLGAITRLLNGSDTLANSLQYQSHPVSPASTTIVDKNYVDVSTVAGAPAMTNVAAGIAFLASTTQLQVGTATSTNSTGTVYSYVVPSQNVNQSSTAFGIPIANVNGVIDTNYISAFTALATTGLAPTLTSCGSAASSATFSYTGASSSFSVPTGVTSMTISARGGQGGTSNGINGGTSTVSFGGQATGTINVSSGQVFYFAVAGIGANGSSTFGTGGFPNGGNGAASGSFIGGGGGGASWVSTSSNPTASSSNYVLVAAGGGGSGGFNADTRRGGSGGGLTGGGGGGTNPGNGGTQTGGGAGSTGQTGAASASATSSVGTPAVNSGGGGGGGGFYGGSGGGGSSAGMGDGGGGSSFMSAQMTSTSTASSSVASSGIIIFSYTVSPFVSTSSNNISGQVYANATNSCTVTFASTSYANAPYCELTPTVSSNTLWITSATTSSFVINSQNNMLINNPVNYFCPLNK